MVYCHNCGTKNEDDAEFCSKCGEPLRDVRDDYEGRRRHHHRDDRYYRQRNECFGLPHGNIIGPLIGGIILILIGLASFTGFQNIWTYIWPAIIIIIGLLIIVGAIYGSRRKR
ncbi:zinc ribbon domain-containing protein [Methanobacterium sp.]|uniref:zinc ribbon domain-containing protein n=1 Tax=Methanobacterium sp. TaxID=2164 RepID=UPI002AB9CFDB|nr:zinc ribbon domain-containing protein [Methanobacterium sp.]MDY9923010.1 zinc ribbon domain-containing protein [Methanobacterium sp.]